MAAGAVLALASACGSGGKAAGAGGGGSGACVAGTAGNASNITVPQEPDSGVATLTGSCWAKVAATAVANIIPGVGQAAIPGGVNPTVQVAWSPKALYVKCNVYAWPLYAAGSQPWTDDACEFFVSGADDHGGTFGANDAQIVVPYNANTPSLGTHGANIDASAFQVLSSVQSGKGYMVELISPWSALGVAHPAKGQTYQFDLGVDYNDDSGSYVAYADVTGENPNPCCSTQNWGQITLG